MHHDDEVQVFDYLALYFFLRSIDIDEETNKIKKHFTFENSIMNEGN